MMIVAVAGSFPNMSALEYTLQQAQSQTQNVTAQLDNGVRVYIHRTSTIRVTQGRLLELCRNKAPPCAP